jgi:hypothetical protein
VRPEALRPDPCSSVSETDLQGADGSDGRENDGRMMMLGENCWAGGGRGGLVSSVSSCEENR